NPFITEKSPYHGAYMAVVESICKLVAVGAAFEDVYLTFQEYFEKPMQDKERWGKPLAALLGAFMAQKDFDIASIGGKDSMSGTFENIDVPPTLVSFAVTTENINNIISPEFKSGGHKVVMIKPVYDENGLPNPESQKKVFTEVTDMMRRGIVNAAYTPTYGGIAEAVLKMAMGNGIGFEYADTLSEKEIFGYNYGAFILEIADDTDAGILLGTTSNKTEISYKNYSVSLDDLCEIYENKLEDIYKCNIKTENIKIKEFYYKAGSVKSPSIRTAKPKMLIPVFPGTNCEYDTAKAMLNAGGDPEIFVINNLSAQHIAESVREFAKKVKNSQIIFIPGGFSGGDEPDGSGKFITAFFRNPEIKDAVMRLLEERDGLMAGICNGFQALIKLGLVPYGKIINTDAGCPTLTYNLIARHQSKMVRTKVVSNNSPWLCESELGGIYTVPISHGEGRFIASDNVIAELEKNGQIITQYVDMDGKPTNDIQFNPNNSCCAIEGICSPDGRIIGKMGHSERIGDGLYKNVPGKYEMGLFKSAVKYYK
ncbi:MAG: phosphoribosylformylglycinamidine synthase subunit PurQ, partial [Firmicutes bacterium]|nr:phosphoribosylformylglycinamidine synthase subunit PurQ [Bacillota bacterium]